MDTIITPEFRVSYPSLFKPTKNKLSGKEEYSVQALFAKNADLTKLKQAVEAAAVEKWGADKTKWPKNLKVPFRDQGDREKDGVLPTGYEKGNLYSTFKSIQRPEVISQNKSPILDANQLYAGCWARAAVRPFAYDVQGGRGVTLTLQAVQKVRDDEPLTGRVKAEDVFTAVEGAASADIFG